jgi:hypothetical protein
MSETNEQTGPTARQVAVAVNAEIDRLLAELKEKDARLAALETVASVARRAVDAIDGATWAEAYPIVAELDAALGNLEEAP